MKYPSYLVVVAVKSERATARSIHFQIAQLHPQGSRCLDAGSRKFIEVASVMLWMSMDTMPLKSMLYSSQDYHPSRAVDNACDGVVSRASSGLPVQSRYRVQCIHSDWGFRIVFHLPRGAKGAGGGGSEEGLP